MKIRTTIVSLFLSAAVLPFAAQAQQHAEHEWDYQGAKGPSHWGELKEDFAGCKLGHNQSPIDIRKTVKKHTDPIVFDYHPEASKVVDNGHTIQLNLQPGSGMTVGGQHYDLVQFHFHTPSEERIHGKRYPLVAHLVHKNAEGKLAVVAVLFKQGKANPMLAQIWSTLPHEQGADHATDGPVLDLTASLPAKHGFYNFAGSLTTPPCSEEVNWFVMKAPVQVSAAQLRQFHHVYQHNARPVQPLHGRVVIEST